VLALSLSSLVGCCLLKGYKSRLVSYFLLQERCSSLLLVVLGVTTPSLLRLFSLLGPLCSWFVTYQKIPLVVFSTSFCCVSCWLVLRGLVLVSIGTLSSSHFVTLLLLSSSRVVGLVVVSSFCSYPLLSFIVYCVLLSSVKRWRGVSSDSSTEVLCLLRSIPFLVLKLRVFSFLFCSSFLSLGLCWVFTSFGVGVYL